MSKNVELKLTFARETHRFINANGDVMIGWAFDEADNARPRITIKGPAEIDELEFQQTYRFYGRWVNYTNPRTRKTERQFVFSTFVQNAPLSRAGVIAYITQAGKGLGIGSATVSKIFDKFGQKSIETCRTNPAVISDMFPRVTIEGATRMSETLIAKQHLENVTVEVLEILDRLGFPKTTTRFAISTWGNEAAETIKRDPFKLLKFRGCGFKRCDQLWVDLGLPADSLRRQAYCCWYFVSNDKSGSTWHAVGVVAEFLRKSVPKANPIKALRMAKRAGMLTVLRATNDGAISPEGNIVAMVHSSAICESHFMHQIVGIISVVNEPKFSYRTNFFYSDFKHSQPQLYFLIRLSI